MAMADTNNNALILPTGTRFKLSDLYAIDSHKGEVTWNLDQKTDCANDEYDVIYEGHASLITSIINNNYIHPSQTFLVETDKIVFALKNNDSGFVCNIPIIHTEHPRLIIVQELKYTYMRYKPL